MEKQTFTPLEKASAFKRRSLPLKPDGGIKPPSAQTVRERDSLTGFTVGEEAKHVRIDVFLAAHCQGCSRTRSKNLIKEGRVVVNQKIVKPHYCLKEGDEVQVRMPPPALDSLQAEEIPLAILYEDGDVIVLDKPCGMVVHPAAGNPAGTLANALRFHTKELSDINPERPGIVHRLDKDTSGVMVVAKNNVTHLALAKQFRAHSVRRRYIALVKGRVEFKEGLVDLPIKRHPFYRKKMAVSFEPDTKSAQTRYRTLKRFERFSLLELFPHTGRTHQLRVHLAYLKHPILGDDKYGDKNDFTRLALHAKDLGFYHPQKKQFMEFSSALPAEIQAAIGAIHIPPPTAF